MSSSVSKLVGASDFIHIDDLEVRGSVPSNRKPSLALLLSSVACRASPCASARCLQAAQVVGMSRELLERERPGTVDSCVVPRAEGVRAAAHDSDGLFLVRRASRS